MFSFIRSLFLGVKDSGYMGKPMVGTKKKSKSVTTQPAPATPTKAVAVLEEDEESSVLTIAQHPTDLLPQGIIRSEVNFLSFPFFALSRKDAQTRTKTEYHAIVNKGDERRDAFWKVSANSEYGYPRPFDGKVHKAIEYIISEMKPPIQNPVPIGSLYRIAKLMDIADKGRVYKDIKEALLRIQMTGVHSKGTFYSKGKKRWIEQGFSLYERAVFVGEELDNGEIADTNYLFLGSWYLENINARYVKPLDYTYYRALQSPIASRLYELLGVKFYGMGKYRYIRYRYSNLSELLPVTRYQYLSKAKEKLKPAHDELIRTGFLANFAWDTIPGEKHDWYVTYYPGTRAKEEIKRFSNHVALPPPDDSVEAPVPDGTGQATPQPAPATPTKPVTDEVCTALHNFGITKKWAHKLAKDYPEDYILTKLDYVKYLVEIRSPLVKTNPAGFAIRAIEEDYPPPPGYKSKAQLAQEQEGQQKELEQQQQALEELQRAREEARQRLLEQHPPQLIENTPLTTVSAWTKTLEALREQVPASTYAGWLKETLLVKLEQNTAYVLVASPFAKDYLERRQYQRINRTLEDVLGYPVKVEFVVSDNIS
jgi:hypothetical protein